MDGFLRRYSYFHSISHKGSGSGVSLSEATAALNLLSFSLSSFSISNADLFNKLGIAKIELSNVLIFYLFTAIVDKFDRLGLTFTFTVYTNGRDSLEI